MFLPHRCVFVMPMALASCSSCAAKVMPLIHLTRTLGHGNPCPPIPRLPPSF